jgi:hypothetical protein
MVHLLKRKRVVVPLGVVVTLAIAGAALAFFTSTGSGTGSASVGSASAWTVSVSPATGGPLYPGAGTEDLTYTVTNPSASNQALTATSAVVASYSGSITGDAGDVTNAGAPVAGCLASWFTVVNTAPASLPQNLAGSATSTAGSVAVTMQDNGNQNACEGAAPDITVNAS